MADVRFRDVLREFNPQILLLLQRAAISPKITDDDFNYLVSNTDIGYDYVKIMYNALRYGVNTRCIDFTLSITTDTDSINDILNGFKSAAEYFEYNQDKMDRILELNASVAKIKHVLYLMYYLCPSDEEFDEIIKPGASHMRLNAIKYGIEEGLELKDVVRIIDANQSADMFKLKKEISEEARRLKQQNGYKIPYRAYHSGLAKNMNKKNKSYSSIPLNIDMIDL